MANQLLIAVPVSVLLDKAIAMAANGCSLMVGFLDDFKVMEGRVREIQAVVADEEANPTVRLFLRNAEGVAFRAENVLGELLYECARRQAHEIKGGTVAKVCSFFSNDITFRRRMASTIRGINDKLKNLILENCGNNSLLLPVPAAGNFTVSLTPQSNSQPEQIVVGRAWEESIIVDTLLGSSNHNAHLPILPIFGMGGSGKTTLAKLIFNNERINNWFRKKIWICVSATFEVASILKWTLESLKGESVDMTNLDAIVHGIQQELSGERVLFVLDDVWNEDKYLWNKFFTSLVGLNPASGSCCILTTRSPTTVNLVSTFFTPVVLDKLSDDACWQILCGRATRGGEVPEELNVYREQILRRCQGLPLAANAIGSLLSLERKDNWLWIVENMILNSAENVEGAISPILKLSYVYLPSSHIKNCFVYCSVYPKDARLDAQELIELWMARGFLQEGVEGKTMEDLGADYLTILCQSSLLEKVNDCYQMHDLVHDLAESISQGVQFRHLALGDKDDYWNASSALVQTVNDGISDKMLLKYRHAQVLRLSSTEIVNLPKAIGKLKHLHYLDLSLGKIKSLPESLSTLYNLQTLRLYDCPNLQCLPQGLSNLINLRHLHFYSGDCNLEMPPKLGRLTCLQTLYFFNVMEKNDGRGIEELGSMRNLKGNLVIRNLELVKGKEEARMVNLCEKQNLIGLELEWHTYSDDIENCDDESVLEGLEPSPNLQKLSITSFMGIRFPQWLGKLSELELYDCKNCTELVGLDHGNAFPKLVSLSIHWCCKLSSAPSSFPSLETLTILGRIQVSVVRDIIGKTSDSLKTLKLSQMVGLGSLSEAIGNHHNYSLEKLEISSCDDLTDIPSSTLECLPHLESFEVEGCPNLLSCPMNLQRTPSLSTILFSGCPKVFSTDAMPKGFNHLTSLKELSIGPFSDDSISLFDWSGLVQGCSSTLQNLYLDGSLQKHSLLPEQLQYFSSLEELKLYGFESVECLPDWFSDFKALRELGLLSCRKLQRFLPTHVIECLNNLRRLDICDCPLLKESPGHEISDLSNLEVIRS